MLRLLGVESGGKCGRGDLQRRVSHELFELSKLLLEPLVLLVQRLLLRSHAVLQAPIYAQTRSGSRDGRRIRFARRLLLLLLLLEGIVVRLLL